ncbi:MAG: hypothetical protein LBM39_00330, partial [Candidatus Methanoplasma sp.]|jgi:transposase|nr:hypothetical protein [Candidatus Methanoplasma sp.]
MIVDGRTFREAAAAVDRSTGSVREWVGKCLQKHGKRIVRGKIRVKKTGYVFKNRYRTMPGTKKRGPPKGVNRERAEHKDKVIATEKEHPFERTGRWSQHGLHIDQKERYNIRIK